jgi:hypothetical protein
MSETPVPLDRHGKPRWGPGSSFVGRKGRSGVPRDTRNNLRHGLQSSKLPTGCKHVENSVNRLRRRLEDAVLALKGDISITDAAYINTVLKHERHGQLASTWLRRQYEELSALERLKFSEAIAKSSDCRDKAIRALRLDGDTDRTTIAALYTRIPLADSAGELEDK